MGLAYTTAAPEVQVLLRRIELPRTLKAQTVIVCHDVPIESEIAIGLRAGDKPNETLAQFLNAALLLAPSLDTALAAHADSVRQNTAPDGRSRQYSAAHLDARHPFPRPINITDRTSIDFQERRHTRSKRIRIAPRSFLATGARTRGVVLLTCRFLGVLYKYTKYVP